MRVQKSTTNSNNLIKHPSLKSQLKTSLTTQLQDQFRKSRDFTKLTYQQSAKSLLESKQKSKTSRNRNFDLSAREYQDQPISNIVLINMCDEERENPTPNKYKRDYSASKGRKQGPINIFQSIENNLQSQLNQLSRKKNYADKLTVKAMHSPRQDEATMELKRELIKAIDELSQDVEALKVKHTYSIIIRRKFQSLVKTVIKQLRIKKARQRFQNHYQRHKAAKKLQHAFISFIRRKKAPIKILKRVFGCSYNDGIYLGWRVRKVFKHPNIQDQIHLLKKRLYIEEPSQIKGLKEQLLTTLNSKLEKLKYTQIERLQKQIDVSDEVLRSLETSNAIDNLKLYQYLCDFDSLLNTEKKGGNLFEGLKPYSENNYETFNKLKQPAVLAPTFMEEDSQILASLDKPYCSKPSTGFNSSHNLHRTHSDFFIFDYNRKASDIFSNKLEHSFENQQKVNEENNIEEKKLKNLKKQYGKCGSSQVQRRESPSLTRQQKQQKLCHKFQKKERDFTFQKSSFIESKNKREQMINGINTLFEEVEMKNGQHDESYKALVQLELEKIFIQLRTSFTDLLNNS